MISVKRLFSLQAPPDSGQEIKGHFPSTNPTIVTIPELIALRHASGSVVPPPTRIASQQSGGYRSPFKGRGMEFSEARPYQQGDDIRSMDWRLTARLGKPHTKVFQEERERAVMLWVDLHPSMFFATQGVFKAVQAARAAGLFAWSAAQRQDRLGGMVFSHHGYQDLRPGLGEKYALRFFRLLVDHPAWQKVQIKGTAHTNAERAAVMADSLVRLRRVGGSGSLVVLFSDMRSLGEQSEVQLGRLARDNQVILCFLHDALEAALPPPGWYQLNDGKQDFAFHSGSEKYRQDYAQRFVQRKQALERLCQRLGIFFLPLASNEQAEQVLHQHLAGLFIPGARAIQQRMHGKNRMGG